MFSISNSMLLQNCFSLFTLERKSKTKIKHRINRTSSVPISDKDTGTSPAARFSFSTGSKVV
jgi:hypothetical protein